MGLDERWLVLVLEEAGYAGLPQPIVETAAVAAPIIGERGDVDAMVASDLGGPIVPWAAEADQLLLGDPERGLVLVPRAAVELEPVHTVDAPRRGQPGGGRSRRGPGRSAPMSSWPSTGAPGARPPTWSAWPSACST